VNAAAAPRLGVGFVASVLLHGGLIAAFMFMRGEPPPQVPIYRVSLIAGPAGERAVGVVQPQPVAPTPEAPPPVAAKTPPVPKKNVPAPKAKTAPTPKPVTPSGPPKAAEKTPPPQPAAGGGPEGGKGADVATVDIPGIEFPYPWYTDNIVRRIITQFGTSSARFTAEVRFVIRRDGTVVPGSISFVTRSGNYSFDTKAMAAIEAVANAKLFGPLPPGFQEDILPVTFRFSPQLWR
jgi:protein TonB